MAGRDHHDSHQEGADLEVRLALALQANARASWRDIAEVVGVSETTVARRVRDLLDAGTIRITAIADTMLCHLGRTVLVQVSCAPNAIQSVAEWLSRRDDTRFVAVVAGDYDVHTEIVVPDRRALSRLLTVELAALPGVRSSATQTALRQFKGAAEWAAQQIALPSGCQSRTVDAHAPADVYPMDPVDRVIFEHLTVDGRRGNSEIASAIGLSEAAVRRRLDLLIGSGRVRPMTLVDPEFLGYDIEAMIRLKVNLRALPDIATRLAAQPEVRYLLAVGGAFDLIADAVFRDEEDLFRFRTEVLGGIDGLNSVDTLITLGAVKRSFVRSPPGYVESGVFQGGDPATAPAGDVSDQS